MLAHQHFLGGRVGVAPAGHVALDQLPAGHQLVRDQAVELAVGGDDTGTREGRAAVADQLIIHNLVGVASRVHHGAPVDDGLADLAVGAAGVARLQAGLCLVVHGRFRMRVMPLVGRILQLGLHGEGAAEGHGRAVLHRGVAEQDFHVDGHDRAVTRLILGLRADRLAGDVVHAIPGPDAYGQGHQRLRAGQRAVRSLGQGDVHHVLHGVDVGGSALGGHRDVAAVCIQQLVLRGEAGSDDHVLQLPGVGGVQADVGLDDLHLAHIGGLHVHIVDGIVLGQLTGVIAAGDVDQGRIRGSCDDDGRVLLGAVAHAVGDLEGHHVLAVVKGDGFRGGHDAAVDLGGDLHAVHIDLRGGIIQADVIVLGNVVGHAGGEDHAARADGRAVRRDRLIRGSVHDVADDGLLTVIHSRAVVQRDVVEVEGEIGRHGGLDVEADEAGLTMLLTIRIHSRHIIPDGQVNIAPYPTACGNLILAGRIQPLAAAGKNPMQLGTCRRFSRSTGVGGQLHGQARSPFGNVNPCAEAGCCLAVGNVAQHALAANIEEHVVAPARIAGMRIVKFHTQRILAVLHLAVARRCQERPGSIVLGEVAAIRSCTDSRITSKTDQGAIRRVCSTPVLCSINAKPLGNIAILEVPARQDLRALAEGDLKGQRIHFRVLVGRGDGHAGDSFIRGRGVGQAVQRTGGLVAHGPSEVVHGEIHREFLGRVRVHFQRQLRALAIGQDGAFLREGNIRRVADHHGGRGGGVLHGVLDGHLAQRAVGGEHAVLVDGTVGFIRQGPHAAGGHVHFQGGGVDGDHVEVKGRAGRHVLVGGLADGGQDLRMVEGTGDAVAGDGQEDGVDGGTLGAVGGRGAHHQAAVAGAAGDEGGGAAAVAVDRVNAAQRQHQLAHLVVGQAGGDGAIAAVAVDDHQRAVGLDAQHGAGRVGGGALHRRGDQLTILDQPAEVDAHHEALLDGAVLVVGQGLAGGTQIAGTIVEDGQVGLAAGMDVLVRVVLVHQHLVLKHEEAVGRVAVVRQGDVHAADQRVAQGVLVVLGGLGHFHGLPGTRVLGIELIKGIVTGQNVDLAGVHLEDVDFLAVVASGVVQDDLGFRRAGDHGVIVFLDDVEVAVADGGVVPAAGTGRHQGLGGLLAHSLVQLGQVGQLGGVLLAQDGHVRLGQRLNGLQGSAQLVIAGVQLVRAHQGQHGLEQHPALAAELAVVSRDGRLDQGLHVRQGSGIHRLRSRGDLSGFRRSRDNGRGSRGRFGRGGDGRQGLLVQRQQIAADVTDDVLVHNAVPDVAVVGHLGAGHGQDGAGLLDGRQAGAGSRRLLTDVHRVGAGPGQHAVLRQRGHLAALAGINAGLLHQHVQVDVVVKLVGADLVRAAGDSAFVVTMDDGRVAVVNVGDDTGQLLTVDLDHRQVAHGRVGIAAAADQRTLVVHHDAQILVGVAMGEVLLRQARLGRHPVDEQRSPVRLGRTVPLAVHADTVLLGVAHLRLRDGHEVGTPVAGQLDSRRLSRPVGGSRSGLSRGFGRRFRRGLCSGGFLLHGQIRRGRVLRLLGKRPCGQRREQHDKHQQIRHEALPVQLSHVHPSFLFLLFMIAAPWVRTRKTPMLLGRFAGDEARIRQQLGEQIVHGFLQLTDAGEFVLCPSLRTRLLHLDDDADRSQRLVLQAAHDELVHALQRHPGQDQGVEQDFLFRDDRCDGDHRAVLHFVALDDDRVRELQRVEELGVLRLDEQAVRRFHRRPGLLRQRFRPGRAHAARA